jgi:hypothetical protein
LPLHSIAGSSLSSRLEYPIRREFAHPEFHRVLEYHTINTMKMTGFVAKNTAEKILGEGLKNNYGKEVSSLLSFLG